MRTLLVLSGLCLVLFSCRTKEPDAVGIAQCHIKCSFPEIKVKLPHSGTELQGMWMIRHMDNYTKNDTINISGQQTFSIIAWADYDVFLPAINSNYVFGATKVVEREIDSYCGDECVSPVVSIATWYNYKPHAFSIVLTGKNEYTIML